MEEEVIRILQLSDLHLGYGDREAGEVQDLVERILLQFGNEENKPWILFTGDTVDDGKEEQFQVAQELLSPLREHGFTVHFLPGNHDYGWNGNIASEESRKCFNQYLAHDPQVHFPKTWSVGEHFLVILDSMCGERDWWDKFLADGELGHKQMQELEATLLRLNAFRKERHSKVVVALHHHPFAFPDQNSLAWLGDFLARRLKDHEALQALLKDHCDALIFGHQHQFIDFSTQLRDAKIPEMLGVAKVLACGSSTHARSGSHPSQQRGWLLYLDRSPNVTVEAW